VNAIKNAIVTLTLLGVGYGAYVVLNDPTAPQLGDILAHQPWSAPPDGSEAVTADVPQVTLGTPTPEVPAEVPQPGASATALPAPTDFPTQPPGGSAAPTIHGALVEAPAMPAGADLNRGVSPGLSAANLAGHGAFGGPTDLAASPRAGGEPSVAAAAESTAHAPALAPPGNQTASIYAPVLAPPGNQTASIYSAPAVADHLRAPETSGPATTAPAVDPRAFEAAWEGVQEKLRRGELAQALFALSIWYNDPSIPQDKIEACQQLLDQLAGTVIYSRQHLLEPPYPVQPGDSLAQIAHAYDVTLELLARINGIEPPYELHPGEPLKVVRGPFRGELSLARRELTLFLGRYYAGRFPVEIGSDMPQVELTYDIAEKTLDRPYFHRQLGRELPAGHPENPYGKYWLGLHASQLGPAGDVVGLHSTPPSSSPDDARGCIRLSSRHAEDVHAILALGSQVVVRR